MVRPSARTKEKCSEMTKIIFCSSLGSNNTKIGTLLLINKTIIFGLIANAILAQNKYKSTRISRSEKS